MIAHLHSAFATQVRCESRILDMLSLLKLLANGYNFKTVWPSGLRRWLKAPFRKGVGSNPTAVTASRGDHWKRDTRAQRQHLGHRCRFGHPKHEGPEWGNQTRRATDTYDWGNQCLKTRNHEKGHEGRRSGRVTCPPQKKTTSGGKGRINQVATHGHAPDTQGGPP